MTHLHTLNLLRAFQSRFFNQNPSWVPHCLDHFKMYKTNTNRKRPGIDPPLKSKPLKLLLYQTDLKLNASQKVWTKNPHNLTTTLRCRTICSQAHEPVLEPLFSTGKRGELSYTSPMASKMSFNLREIEQGEFGSYYRNLWHLPQLFLFKSNSQSQIAWMPNDLFYTKKQSIIQQISVLLECVAICGSSRPRRCHGWHVEGKFGHVPSDALHLCM